MKQIIGQGKSDKLETNAKKANYMNLEELKRENKQTSMRIYYQTYFLDKVEQKYLFESKSFIYKYGQNQARPHEKNMAKCVLVLIIRSTNYPVAPYVPNNRKGAPQKYQLH